MTFQLSRASEQRLVGVHPDLIRVVRVAILQSKIDFTVSEGLRTLDRQRELFSQGRSQTIRSRHLTGHAVDLVPLRDIDGDGDLDASWKREDYFPVVDAMRASAAAAGVLIEWGGDWQTFHDLPHWQLPWSRYP